MEFEDDASRGEYTGDDDKDHCTQGPHEAVIPLVAYGVKPQSITLNPVSSLCKAGVRNIPWYDMTSQLARLRSLRP